MIAKSFDPNWNGAKTRLTTHLPEELVANVARAAALKGQTLSIWVQRAAEAALRAQHHEILAHKGKGQ